MVALHTLAYLSDSINIENAWCPIGWYEHGMIVRLLPAWETALSGSAAGRQHGLQRGRRAMARGRIVDTCSLA